MLDKKKHMLLFAQEKENGPIYDVHFPRDDAASYSMKKGTHEELLSFHVSK